MYTLKPFGPSEWPTYYFSLQYHPWINHWGHEKEGNDHGLRKLVGIQQILLISTRENLQRTVWKIWPLILGLKALGKKTNQCGKVHMFFIYMFHYKMCYMWGSPCTWWHNNCWNNLQWSLIQSILDKQKNRKCVREPDLTEFILTQKFKPCEKIIENSHLRQPLRK